MADDTNEDIHDRDALTEVRAALESVERRQGEAARERRRLKAELDDLIGALREDALVLRFDLDRELVEARGPLQDQLGASAAELLARFDDFADEETIDALDEANKAVLDDDGTGACVSDGFLRGGDEDLAMTFVHIRRRDEDGEVVGSEAIGLVAPAVEPDDDLDAGVDPFDDLLQRIARRLSDDAGGTSVVRAVQTFGDFLLADRVVVNRYDEEARRFSTTASWMRGDTRPLEAEERGISISELPWAYSALGAGEAVVISRAADLPPDAGSEKELYAQGDVSSALLLPMVRGDDLTGFVSVQSVQGERDWNDTDVARCRAFVTILSAALARSQVEDRLEELRRDFEVDAAKRRDAESRAEEAEARAGEVRGEVDELRNELEGFRGRMSDAEAEAERAREAEKEAREAADQARADLETARREAEEARGELDGVEMSRAEMESLKSEAERAQRRSEDAAADALAVRSELEDVRRQLDEALRDAAELRAGGVVGATAAATGAALVGGAEQQEEIAPLQPEEAEQQEEMAPLQPEEMDATEDETPTFADQTPTFDPDATLEMTRVEADHRFDPDATVEMETPALEAVGDAQGAEGPEPEDEAREVEGLPRAKGLDEMLEHTQTSSTDAEDAAERGPEEWKEDKTSWEDRTGEVDLPEFLHSAEGDDDDVDSDVEAARQMARQAAGRDDEPMAAEQPPAVILPDAVERTGELDAYERAREQDDDDGAEADGLPPLAGIDTDVGLADVGGNVELYRSLLGKFHNDYVGAAAKINAAIEKGNIEVAHLLLHAVKGVSGVLGALRVRACADDLETKLIGRDPEATRAAVGDFTAALTEVLESIGSLDDSLPEPSAPAPPPDNPAVADAGEAPIEKHVSDPMVLRSYLSGLRQHLVAEKTRQCQLVMREISARNWPGDFNQRVAELARQIEAGEFASARDGFDELMGQFADD